MQFVILWTWNAQVGADQKSSGFALVRTERPNELVESNFGRIVQG